MFFFLSALIDKCLMYTTASDLVAESFDFLKKKKEKEEAVIFCLE